SNIIYLMDISNSRYLTVYPTTPNWRCYTSTTAQGVGSQITLIEYSQKVVNYISVTTMPTITSYDLSDALDTTGLVITATYSDSSTEDVTSGCTYSPTVLSVTGTQTIIVTHTGSGKTTSFDVTVSTVTITSISVTSMPYKTTYIQGNSLVTAGIVITATYSNTTTADVTSDCTYSPSPFTTAGTQTVTVTHTLSGLTTSFDVTVNSRPGYMFGENTDFADWTTAYAQRTLNYPNFAMTFSNADKNSVTITDMPVSKGGTGIFTSNSLPIKSITFGFTQWTTKTQTISLNKYKDNAIPEGDVATTLDFPTDGTTITRTFSTVDVYEVEVAFSTADNQIGWEYVNAEFYDTTNATAFAENFLASITCDGGITPPSIANWATLASTFTNDLTADDQAIFYNAIANESGSVIDQCVARYDFIVAKYGTTSYPNFMARTINQSAPSHGLIFSNYDTNMTILVVMSISLLSFTGLSLLMKKKKQNH
ncbi:MAG: bacterial Ig-like domain-containing protein, partial [Bacilli bacterium]